MLGGWNRYITGIFHDQLFFIALDNLIVNFYGEDDNDIDDSENDENSSVDTHTHTH